VGNSEHAIGAGTGAGGAPFTTVLEVMMNEAESRLMVMCMCIKNSDIAHAAKPWAQHEQVQ
jgi:selenophosphate synthase